jgi:hypothetical protein
VEHARISLLGQGRQFDEGRPICEGAVSSSTPTKKDGTMPKFADSGPGLDLRSKIRRESQKVRLQEIVAARRDDLARAKRQWRKASNVAESLGSVMLSPAGRMMPSSYLRTVSETSREAQTQRQAWLHAKERHHDAVGTLHTYFPPLWLKAWQWLTSRFQ